MQTTSSLTLTIDGVTSEAKYGGLYTNGSAQYNGSIVVIKESNFASTAGNGAAYLASKHNYTFEDCTFTGYTGLYIKSGDLTLTDCTMTADGASKDPSWWNNGAELTGSALVIDSAAHYQSPMTVVVNGGSYSSVNGYAIEDFVTSEPGKTQDQYHTLTIGTGDDAPTLTGGKGPRNTL